MISTADTMLRDLIADGCHTRPVPLRYLAEQLAQLLGDHAGHISGPGYNSDLPDAVRHDVDRCCREFRAWGEALLRMVVQRAAVMSPFYAAADTAAMPRRSDVPPDHPHYKSVAETAWHQDHTHWSDPISCRRTPFRVLAMMYLADVGPGDGPFEFIPGSHTTRHAMHDAPLSSLRPGAYDYEPDPRDVRAICGPVGTVFFADCRVLHRAAPRTNPGFRPAVLQWFDSTSFSTHIDRTGGPA